MSSKIHSCTHSATLCLEITFYFFLLISSWQPNDISLTERLVAVWEHDQDWRSFCSFVCRILKYRCEIYELDETLDKKWQWFDVPVFWRHNGCSKLHQHTLTYPRTMTCTVLTFRRQECEISVCLSAWRSPISETAYICLGVPTSACTWRKRRRKRRTAVKPCVSATWSTTDLFRNVTTTSHTTYSFFIDMTNQ
jgi:hypothetical protein